MPNGKTKRYNIKPTLQQKKAFEKVADLVRKNPGKNIKIGKVLAEAGYSKTVAESPTKVTESAGWQALLDKNLSEKKLTETHAKLLNSPKESIQIKAVELGYRLRKKLGAEADDGSGGSGYEELTAVVMRIRRILPE